MEPEELNARLCRCFISIKGILTCAREKKLRINWKNKHQHMSFLSAIPGVSQYPLPEAQDSDHSEREESSD